MLRTLRAEFRRACFQRSSLIFIGISVLVCLLIIGFNVASILSSENAAAAREFEKSLSFPVSIFTAISVSLIYLVILTPMMSAFIVGSDYSLDTLKMILPREPREHFPIVNL